MNVLPAVVKPSNAEYPTSDGRPMAETDLHRDLMVELIDTLKAWFAGDPKVYVSGNLLVFYERGNRRRHLSPDVFVVKGVPNHARLNYLTWEEGRGPDFVIELTSSSTRHEDVAHKKRLYRDVLGVREYFLFDPYADYLDPPLQGYRLEQGQYVAIGAVDGRLPSVEVGLHLERNESQLRLYDPAAGAWLPTAAERERQLAEAARQAEQRLTQEARARKTAERQRSREAKARLKAEQQQAAEAEARRRIEQENARLRAELDALRRGNPPPQP